MIPKILNTRNLAELAKRVPPNQVKEFEKFRNETLEYHRRVNSLPDKLRPIDWDLYRRYVRDSFAKVVDQFQVKYEELDHSFAQRHEVLNTSKYYTEWQELEANVRTDVQEFIDASRNRVNIYQEEMRRLKNLKYENMTIEEFIEAREDLAHMIPGQGKPLFWPHTAEEQIIEHSRESRGANDEQKLMVVKEESKTKDAAAEK